jgi:hypothetical protein
MELPLHSSVSKGKGSLPRDCSADTQGCPWEQLAIVNSMDSGTVLPRNCLVWLPLTTTSSVTFQTNSARMMPLCWVSGLTTTVGDPCHTQRPQADHGCESFRPPT